MQGGMIIPQYVVKILSESFSSLHQIKLVGRGVGKDQNQKSLGKGSFPSLSVIELGEGSDCIWEFFAQASLENLKTLVVSNANLFSEGDHELSSMQDIIKIITLNCSSLVKVEIEAVVDETREELKGQGKGKGKKKNSAKTSRFESQSLGPLSFPCLASFSIKSISATQFSTFYTFVSFFAQLQYPVLINLEVSGEGSAKERASLAQMMKVFKSNALLVGKGIRQE